MVDSGMLAEDSIQVIKETRQVLQEQADQRMKQKGFTGRREVKAAVEFLYMWKLLKTVPVSSREGENKNHGARETEKSRAFGGESTGIIAPALPPAPKGIIPCHRWCYFRDKGQAMLPTSPPPLPQLLLIYFKFLYR